MKVRVIGREHWKRLNPEILPRRHEDPTVSVFLLGKTIQLLPDAHGELRAAFRALPVAGVEVADEFLPANPAEVERYLARAFGGYLAQVRSAMEVLATVYERRELNRVGLQLYEQFRPTVPYGSDGPRPKAVLKVEKILAAAHAADHKDGAANFSSPERDMEKIEHGVGRPKGRDQRGAHRFRR